MTSDKQMELAIRFACVEDEGKIQSFLQKHWKHDHVFVKNSSLLKWQHLCGNHYNFVVAEHHSEIVALLGYISACHYVGSPIKAGEEIWLAIWKNSNESLYPSAGFRLLRFLEKELKPLNITAIGINDDVAKLYRSLRYDVGELCHFVLINPMIVAPKIYRRIEKVGLSDFLDPFHDLSVIRKIYHLEQCASCTSLVFSESKTKSYFINRFERHPTYAYYYLEVFTGNELQCLLVCRDISIGDARCSRVVDCIFVRTKPKANSSALINYLIDESLEYIDFYTCSSCLPRDLGFREVKRSEEIVPNYFEPYVPENISIKFARKYIRDLIYKGDSDQDRPNY